ncbi:MAG: type II toxin-antitoxin system RelE/ParE family toxin [Candidatus Aminicenantes bacterium]|nr:type II toxin-antitoxin system RelE/ParE family toxin [Candidatus Aminicenantes bacterium]
MAWQIEFDSEAADDLGKLDRDIQRRIIRYLRDRIATENDPRRFGAPLRRELSGLWKYRVGDYRLICRIERKKLIVYVIRIGHRREIYKAL